MRSIRQQARHAGLLYVLMIATGLPGLILIPARLVVDGDPTSTAERIRSAEMLFRLGIASEMFHQVVFLFLAFALYRLLADAGKDLATQMVVLVAVSVPIVFVNAVSEMGAQLLVSRPSALAGFSSFQLDSLAYLFMRLRDDGYVAAEVFWGLWLVPFGRLVIRSGFMPKALGVLLLVAACGELLRPVINLFPALDTPVLARIVSILALGELPIVLYLAIRGAGDDRRRGPPSREIRLAVPTAGS